MLKAETLRELQKATTFMPARQFVQEFGEELANLPRAQPYVQGVMNGQSNAEIRGAMTALAVVVRMELDELLKGSKPVSVKHAPAPIPVGLRVKRLPAQPGDRSFNQEDRRNFRKAVELIKEVETKIKADDDRKHGRGQAKSATVKEGREPKVEVRAIKPVIGDGTVVKHVFAHNIELTPSYMGAVQEQNAIKAFFVDARRQLGGELGACPKMDSKENDSTFNSMKRSCKANPFVIQSNPNTKTGSGLDVRDIIERNEKLLSSHPATKQYMLLYRRAQINANNMFEAARRVFGSMMGTPLRDKVDVRGWKRGIVPGAVTTEKLLAYEDAKNYVVNMTQLGLTIQDPVTYPIDEQLRIERRLSGEGSTKTGKSGAKSGKGRSLARLLSDAVFGVGLAGSADDIDKMVNGDVG